MKDRMLFDERLFKMVLDENLRQLEKWGIQDATPFEWLTYTTEELGEMARAIAEHSYRNGLQSDVVKEAIQTATLCLKIAEMYLNLERVIEEMKEGKE
jgi:NTP pyrophosphatase (non-canonical NTP hydrolase)